MAGISSLIFATRNLDKAAHGDVGRYGVVAAQAANVTNAAAESSVGFIADGAKKVLSGVDNVGESIFHVADASSKVAKVASKAVNPLLIGAAGIRVLKDDDKKSRAIEEATALAGMFAGEKAYKLVRNTISQNMGKTLQEGQKVIKNEKVAGVLSKAGKKLGELTKNSTGKQKALFVAAEVGFVATSILAYDGFKKLGTKITGRDKQQNTDASQTQNVNQDKMQVLA